MSSGNTLADELVNDELKVTESSENDEPKPIEGLPTATRAIVGRPTTAEGLFHQIEQVGKAAVVIVALLYAIGLVITNAYLLRFGVSEFSLLRARFVLTGLLVTTPLAVAGFSVYYAVDFVIRPLRKMGERWSNKYIVRQISFLICSFLIYAGIVFLPAIYWLGYGFNPFGATLQMSIAGLVPFVVFYSEYIDDVIKSRLNIQDKPDSGNIRLTFRSLLPSPRGSALPLLVLVGVLFSSLYLASVTNNLYPNVPEQFGGGQSREIRLIFRSNPVAPLGDFVNPTELIELIWHSESGYLVRLSDDSIVFINNGLVDAVVLDAPKGTQVSAPESGVGQAEATPSLP